jgi:putative membrane protein
LLGGLLTWIPPAMMSVLGILIILRRAMHEDGRYPKQTAALAQSSGHTNT